MSSIYDEYAILQSMIKLYLLQEYSSDARIIASAENYDYFKNYAVQKKKPALPKQNPIPSVQLPKTTPPPPQIDSIQKKEDVKLPASAQSEPLVQAEKITSNMTTFIGGKLGFELNPLGAAVEIDLTNIRKRFVENFPGHPVIETISAERVSDSTPQNVKVVVTAFSEEPTHLTFLNNLSKAINDSLCSAAMIQSYDIKPILESSELRILIAQENELMAHAYLSQHIEKLRQKNVVIIFLSPIEDYLSTPKLKVQLWHKIKNLYNRTLA